MDREVRRRRTASSPQAARWSSSHVPLGHRPASPSEGPAQAHPTLDLRLLGPFALRQGTGTVRAVPKKAQALLAYLAIARGRAVPREQLAELLWGHSGGEHARRSLRQCLMSVRAALNSAGNDTLVSDGDSVSLDVGKVEIDVAAFETYGESYADEELKSAAALYRDEFLSGLLITSEPFADWLLIERRRLASTMSEVLYRLASVLSRGGDAEGAIAAAERLTYFDPLREDAHRLLMHLLASAGRRSAAIKQYTLCTEILRRDLGVAPERTTTELAEEIRGGIFAMDRAAVTVEGSTRVRGDNVATAGALALPEKPSVALLPLNNLGGDADQEYFADGMAEDLAIALGRIPWLFVIASSSTAAYRGHLPDIRQVGAELGVRYVLRGSVRRDARRLRVIFQLADASDGRHIWSDRFDGELDDVFAIQDRVAAQVSATVAPALQGAEIERTRRQPTDSLTAYDLYLRAVPRFRASLADNVEALRMLRKAIELDPAYGGAYGFASRCYQFQMMFGWKQPGDPDLEEGVRLGHMAAKLGQNDSEALWMAGHALSLLSGETEHGLALIERSLELNPNSANAWISSCALNAFLGNGEKAIDHYARAQRLNPLDSMQHFGWNLVAMAHFSAGNFSEAERSVDKALHAAPKYPPALRVKIAVCGQLGRIEEGREHVKRLLGVHPEASVSWLKAFWAAPYRSNPAILANLLEGARRSGLPEA